MTGVQTCALPIWFALTRGTIDLGAPFDGPASKGEPTPTVAASLGAGTPSSLAATAGSTGIKLTWAPPPSGTVISYEIYRVVGSAVTPANLPSRVLVATVPGNVTQFLDAVGHHGDDGHHGDRDDDDDCKGGSSVSYTYFMVAIVSNPSKPGTTLRSGASNFKTVTASACHEEKRDR